jgi:uncharacterized protein (TIGR03437 family)
VVQVARSQSFTTLDVPGAASTQAVGINNSRQVVLNAPYCYWYDGRTFLPITVGGATYCYATGISDDGQIVGYFRGPVATPSYVFIYYQGRVLASLSAPGADDTASGGISSNGAYTAIYIIVGPWRGPNPSRALIYHNGDFTGVDVPWCQGTNSSATLGVNNSGQAVGNCNGSFGFFSDNGASKLVVFPASQTTVATGIDNFQQICGYYKDKAGRTHGFLYSLKDGVYQTLDYPGAKDTFAQGVNDYGDVVGYYSDTAGKIHGFLFRSVSNGPVAISTASPLPDGKVGVSYTQGLTATGGTPPYKWAVAAGQLPPGIALTEGVLLGNSDLSGIPTAAGTFNFQLQVTDSAGATATTPFNLNVTGVKPMIKAIGSAASGVGGSVARGEIVTIYVPGAGPATIASWQLDSQGRLATDIGGTEVIFDGIKARMIYAMAGQVSCIVPYGLTGSSTKVQVSFLGQISDPVSVPVAAAVPGIFTANATTSGPGAIVNQDGIQNSAAHPAKRGETVMVYATGEGQTDPPGVDGQLNTGSLPRPLAQVTATVGGIPATVMWVGGAPGFVAGLLQVNVTIPQGIPAGGALPIVLTIGGNSSQANVTVAVQ